MPQVSAGALVLTPPPPGSTTRSVAMAINLWSHLPLQSSSVTHTHTHADFCELLMLRITLNPKSPDLIPTAATDIIIKKKSQEEVHICRRLDWVRALAVTQLRSAWSKRLRRSVYRVSHLLNCSMGDVILSNIFHFLRPFSYLFKREWIRVQLPMVNAHEPASLLPACFRYDGQACGVPGGKHGKARPPLQSLQDESAPQM